jgi:hypothetical protein
MGQITVNKSKNMFSDAKRYSGKMVAMAVILLLLASGSLLGSTLWASHRAFMVGQVFFVTFVFSAVTVLVVTAIAQDIRGRKHW